MELKKILKLSLEESMSYTDYNTLLTRLVDDKSTTGVDQTTDLINYTFLNLRRVKRWEKTIKLEEDVKNRMQTYTSHAVWLTITESWCGDAAHVMPVLNKLASYTPNVQLRIVLRDKNPKLMDAFLTNGSRSIPKVIMLNPNTFDVLNTYGPRPSKATEIVKKFKKEYGNLTPEFKEDLQRWYNNDKGQTIIQDVLDLLGV